MQLKKFSPITGVILATLLSACGGDEPEPVVYPKLKISSLALSSATASAIAQTPVEFTGGICSGGNSNYIQEFDFGDKTPVSSVKTHTYLTSGLKTVVATCKDTAGSRAVVTSLEVNVAAAEMNGFMGKQWSTYASIDPLMPSLYPVAELTAAGDIYGVWLPSLATNKDVTTGTTNFSSSSWTQSGGLSTGSDKPLFNDALPGASSAAIDLAVSPNGRATTAWMAGSSLWYATKNDLSGAWSTPVQINVPVLDASIKVVVNDAGSGAIAYCTSNGAELITYAGQARQAPVTISKQCDLTDTSFFTIQRHRLFDIAIDNASSTIYAVGIADGATTGKTVVTLKSYTPSGGWTAGTAISDEIDTAPESLSYARSPSGNFSAVAWNQVGTNLKSNVFARLYAKGAWGPIQAVQDDYITKDYSRPLVAINDSGDAFLAMQIQSIRKTFPIEVTNYDASATNPTWSKPFQVSTAKLSATDIAIDKWGTGLITRSDDGAAQSVSSGTPEAGTYSKSGEWSGFTRLATKNLYSKSFHYQSMRALPDGRAIVVTSIYDDQTPMTLTTQPLSSGYVLLK